MSTKTEETGSGSAGVEIYTTPICPYCMMAKRLLNRKNIPFSEVNVMGNRTAKAEMMERANGGHTVPQIFIGGRHVGGCDDLYALEEAGSLDPLLSGVT
ncbi:MAG: glutaredoxin 3 [Pseudomonadota bacterium]